MNANELEHYGVKGMKWGVQRYKAIRKVGAKRSATVSKNLSAYVIAGGKAEKARFGQRRKAKAALKKYDKWQASVALAEPLIMEAAKLPITVNPYGIKGRAKAKIRQSLSLPVYTKKDNFDQIVYSYQNHKGVK